MGNGNGILLEDSSAQIRGNRIEGSYHGISLIGASSPEIVGGNVFEGNTFAISIAVPYRQETLPAPKVNGNDFLGNAFNVQLSGFIFGRIDSLDFRGNYFGTTDPAEIASSVRILSGDEIALDFSGYLDRSSLDPLAQPAPGSSGSVSYLIASVTRNTGEFRPTRGETFSIAVRTLAAASITVRIYPERSHGQGSPLRTLVANAAGAGTQSLVWDGKNASGAYVPDEAYSYRVEASSGSLVSVHDPHYGGYPAANPISFPPPTYNPHANEFFKIDLSTLLSNAPNAEASAVPSRYSLLIYPDPTSASYFRAIDGKPAANGRDLLFWDGRDPSGNLLTGALRYYVAIPVPLRFNSVVVSGVSPRITGALASPNLEVKSDPYLVVTSYNQITRIAYCLDQDARVTMKLLRPGASDPNDAAGVVYTFASNALRSATSCDSGGVPHEEIFTGGIGGGDSVRFVPEDGTYTFTIEARSVVDPSHQTLYRGVVQVRQ